MYLPMQSRPVERMFNAQPLAHRGGRERGVQVSQPGVQPSMLIPPFLLDQYRTRPAVLNGFGRSLT
jgi:hypothetical protein